QEHPSKGKFLADLIVERPEDDSLVTSIEVEEELPDPWPLFMDGSSCVDSSRAGLILTNLEGAEFTYALRFRFNATNNEAEYEALIAGTDISKNRKKTVKNGQARTRESEEYKAEARKVKPQSNHGQQKLTRPKIFHLSPSSFRKVYKWSLNLNGPHPDS
ncbi:reverse transcriptase domain-containing protein, partial [Tanacetum coccineum]